MATRTPSWMKNEEEDVVAPESSPMPAEPLTEAPERGLEEELPSPTPQREAPVAQATVAPSPTPIAEAPVEGQAPTVRTPSWAPQQPEEEGLKADEIRNSPEEMAKVREYMILRKGNGYVDKADEEVYDDFVSHMRWFNVNEVSTIGELRFINNLEDEKKQIAVDAYSTFDKLGNFATNDGVVGALQGVGDYAGAVLLSPSTWLSVGVGKLATSAATATAKTTAINKLISTASSQATERALKSGATQTAARQAGEMAGRELITKAARTRAVQEVVVATIADSGASSFQDYLYQSTLINSGYQEDYSGAQTALAAIGGLAGGFLSAGPIINKGSSGLNDFATRIPAGQDKRAAVDMARTKPELEKAAVAFDGEMTDWLKSVDAGKILAEDSLALRNKAVSLLLDPNPESKSSIVAAMIRTNTTLKRGADDPTIAHQLVSFAKNMAEEDLIKLDEMVKKSTGMTYREYVDIVSAFARESGQGLKIFKDVGDTLGKLVSARSSADAAIVGTKVEDVLPVINSQKIGYVTSLWRRALVSHPATTIVNIQGWAQSTAARALAEVLHGGILGTAGMVSKLVAPKSAFGDQALAKSKRLFEAQVFKVKNLLDPYASREAFEALLESAPEVTKAKLNAEAFGGVSMESAARYGMNPENLVIKNVEKLSDRAARISGVKLQDIYTKSLSFLSKLDQLAKKETGDGLEVLIDSGRLNDLSVDAWNGAAEAALKDTFSMDYTRKGPLSTAAKMVEQLSNMPLVGFLFPFGRFMNNSLAFVMQYSLIGAVPILVRAQRKGFFKTEGVESIFEDATMEGLSKVIVGTGALAVLVAHQRNKEKEGLAWNEERNNTGDVYTVENLAPGSVYLVGARIADLASRGEAVSADLYRTLSDQLSISRITRDLGADNALTDTFMYMTTFRDPELKEEGDDFFGFMTTLAGGSLDILSGFTRPLEPVNAVVGVIADTDTLVDRRMLDKEDGGKIKSLLRYMDNLFAPFIGEENKEGRTTIGPAQQAAASDGEVRDPNPIARIFGERLVRPQNDIDIMLNKVNIAPWTTNERSEIPEWDNLLNEKITPLLNFKARELMKTATWKEANQRTRERLARIVLKDARKEVVTWIEDQGSTNEVLLKQRRDLLRLPASLRVQAKHDLKIDTADRELTFLEIQMISYWVEQRRDFEKYTTGSK